VRHSGTVSPLSAVGFIAFMFCVGARLGLGSVPINESRRFQVPFAYLGLGSVIPMV